ncbi:MAG: hypothetical protein KDE27_13130 [Planctomycetes bacterium]|nr:hypothetical protein [Planctomycetota bacterium]
MSRDPKWRRAILAIVAIAFCLPLAGCEMFVNEFTWLDQAPPPVPDAAAAIAGP